MTITIKQNLVPSSKYSIKCPHTMNAEFITVHNTYNDASAENEVKYMNSNNNQTSYHFAVDDIHAVQGLPLNRNGWHAGDGNGAGNRKSIGIEICYSKSGGDRYRKAEANAVKLIAKLLKERGWGVDRVKQHYDWSKKNCPHRIRAEGRWGAFINAIKSEMNPPKPTTRTIYFETGGYQGAGLTKIHNLLLETKWYYEPIRNDSGALTFKIGGFGEGSEPAKRLEKFLKDNGYWYQIQ